jgi:hypothetical protein
MQIVETIIPKLVAKIMENYILLALGGCITIIASFDLWMSIFGHDTFVLVIKFVNSQFVPCHVNWLI